MTINREALATQIETSFSNTDYPGDENIGRDEVASFLGKHWKDLTPEQVRARRFDLAMFSPEGFSFYLPAFLKTILLHSQRGDTLPDSVVWQLSPPHLDDEWITWFNIMVESLTLQQKKAISVFLVSYKELYPNGNWSALESERERLERAVNFWVKQVL